MRRTTVCLTLIIYLSTAIFLQVNIGSDNLASAQGDSADAPYPWTMFRGNLNNSGYSTSTVPDTNHTFFEFFATDPIWSSAVYYDFKIYFGTGTYAGVVPRKIYSLEVATGKEVWSNTTGGQLPATPLIVGDTLYIGSTDGNMYAFNATTGEQLWTFPTGDYILSSAKYYEGKIFFGSYDRKMYAINATNGNHEWNYTTGDQIWSSPAISDGYIFFGSHDGNTYCLWANNGTKEWNYTTGDPSADVYSSPAVSEDKVFVSYAIGSDGAMLSLDKNTGSLIWVFNTSGYAYSSPAVHDGKVFFGTAPSGGDSFLYALPQVDSNNSDGIIDQNEVLWRVKTYDSSEGGSSPVVADGKVLIGSDFGNRMLCVNETTGEEIWTLIINAGIISSPLVVDGKVFIGAKNGVMYAIGSSGLPLLDIEIEPEANTTKSGRAMKISFLVTHNNQPVEGAFISVSATNGTLTQYGFSTFSDGTQKVKYIAPVVKANTTVTITAKVTKYGFEESNSLIDITIEPTESYGIGSAEDWGTYLVKYAPYIFTVIALIIVNLFLFIFIRRRRASGKKEEGN